MPYIKAPGRPIQENPRSVDSNTFLPTAWTVFQKPFGSILSVSLPTGSSGLEHTGHLTAQRASKLKLTQPMLF